MDRLRLLLFLLLFFALAVFADEGHDHGALTAQQVGSVNFATSCSKAVKADFQRAVALLHSFWYEEAAKGFAAITQKEPACAMAHWGVAMSYFQPLWPAPDAARFQTGSDAVAKAQALKPRTDRERAYIAAAAAFYNAAPGQTHWRRLNAYRDAMAALAAAHPKDDEARIFYSLSITAVALARVPKDKTYTDEARAGALIEPLFVKYPYHPGLAHYIIHAYDNPPLAALGLDAARRYAKIAPAVPHALHMPSHVFIRLGLWDEAITSNRASAKAARDYAERSGMKGGWDQELHALDYLMYSYLQKRDEAAAQQVRQRVGEVTNGQMLSPVTPGYAASAVPARLIIEMQRWPDAAQLKPVTNNPATDAITWQAKGLGAARSGDLGAAREALAQLAALREKLEKAGDKYWAGQVEIQRLEVLSWTSLAEKKKDEALQQARAAADMEDATDKSPVTPGPIAPARELLADMLLATGDARSALAEYEASLRVAPGRYNAISGAAQSAEALGEKEKSKLYKAKLDELKKAAKGGM